LHHLFGEERAQELGGVARPEEALAAAELGADAIGLVFYAKSKRAV